MPWGSLVLPALGVVVVVPAAILSIAQLVRSSSSYARYRRWSQIAQDTDNPKVREYASARAEWNLLDHLAARASVVDRANLAFFGFVGTLMLLFVVVVTTVNYGARGEPFHYAGLHGDQLRSTIQRDVAGVFAVATLMVATIGPWLTMNSARSRLSGELGLGSRPSDEFE